MAKIYGIAGPMSGKMGGTVMSVRNGVQIVRQYQPVVSNPNTAAQVSARARLKLMSQLAAVLAPSIAIRREKNVSGRNLFIKENYSLTSYENSQATIDIPSVKVTKSAVGLSAITVTRTGSSAAVSLSYGDTEVDRVVYIALVRNDDGSLRYYGSIVVERTSESGVRDNFEGVITVSNAQAYVLAYGVRDNTQAARVAFGNLLNESAETVAKLIVSRNLTESDVTLTETRGVSIPAAS